MNPKWRPLVAFVVVLLMLPLLPSPEVEDATDVREVPTAERPSTPSPTVLVVNRPILQKTATPIFDRGSSEGNSEERDRSEDSVPPSDPASLLRADVRDEKANEGRFLEDPGGECAPLGDLPVAACNSEAMVLSEWISLVAEPKKHTWTIVDVGANKGYVIAQLLSLFVNHSVRERTSSRAIFRATRNCGACCQCADEEESQEAARGAPFRIFAFEAVPRIAHFLQGFFKPVPEVEIIAKAVSDRSGTTLMHVGKSQFDETSSLRSGGRFRQQVTTLNDELPADLTTIDMLVTDTEGFDMKVADGASRFLDSGRVGLYIFELHESPDRRSLKDHIHRLAVAGMICYFPIGHPAFRERAGWIVQAPRYVRISHECWRDEFEGRLGGYGPNALCYNRRVPELRKVFRRLETTVENITTPCFPFSNRSSNIPPL